MNDSLGDRMKRYERSSRHVLVRRMPVIVRVDGRAFHTFTSGCKRPFCMTLRYAMDYATARVLDDIQGGKFAYTQSDEASFLLVDYDRHETQAWFDNELLKIVSITASHFAVQFMHAMQLAAERNIMPTRDFNPVVDSGRLPVFDARAFNVPREDVTNYFLWRAKDWERNSLQMYARSFFSHKELEGKNSADIHEMLHEIGKNWTRDLDNRARNGAMITRDSETCLGHCVHISPRYEDIAALIDPFISPVEEE